MGAYQIYSRIRAPQAQLPDLVFNAAFHCGRHAERFVYPAEVVIGEV
jgi:hypothetical protein